ncbi:farnesyl pyrophosphate synthase-like isoform X2 [Solenopsis invicta]|uniref:farnesyl pyrophosphate synthase-like isoform X2 n=1 Tax=Solenopsis invicta TaxID=13686 RepID=UPI00193DB73E|nr:farnesyl pyrophosphate synthase-like isoform X2 [Solenopsis invicta]
MRADRSLSVRGAGAGSTRSRFRLCPPFRAGISSIALKYILTTRHNRYMLIRIITKMAHSNLTEYMMKEKIQLLAIWPSIVEDLTDSRIDNDILNRHMTKVLEYNVPGGKQFRALILIHAYQLLANEQPTKENIRLARILAWCGELIQAAGLMIDDIQDKSVLHRGQPCWYLNDNVGLSVITDALKLKNSVYYILQKYFKGKTCYVNLLETFHNIILKTLDGQILDLQLSKNFSKKLNLNLFTMDQYKCIVRNKTSYYSFVCPVFLAMNLAGIKDPEKFKQAETILLEIGHLFQVQDDFLDFFGDSEAIGKDSTDIQQGKCTWFIVMALQRATPEQREILEECYGFSDPEKVKCVKQLFNDLDLHKVCISYTEQAFNLLRERIQEMSCGLPHCFFLDILNILYRRRS